MASSGSGEEELSSSSPADGANAMDRPPLAPGERGTADEPETSAEKETTVAHAADSDSALPECSRVSEKVPSTELLHQIASYLPKQKHCERLVKILGLEDHFVMMSDGIFATSVTAFNVLHKWREKKSNQATGKVLFDALYAIRKRDVAGRFAKELLSQDAKLSTTDEEDDHSAAIATDNTCIYDRHDANGCPDKSVLREIGAAVSSHEQCVELALKLKIGEDDLYKVVDATFTDTLAREVLAKWMKAHGKNATGSTLLAALCDAKRKDLADRFQDRLLGRGSAPDEVEATGTGPGGGCNYSGTRSPNDKLPSIDLLGEIASCLPKQKHYVRLAERLGLSQQFVKQLGEGQVRSTAALDILYKWRQMKSKSATGKVLLDTLIAINRRDVAACFAEELLGQENLDWEDYCYDNAHRTFFRRLRRHGFNVTAVYERMHCTEDFLGRLHQQNIISRSEYDKLLESSKVLHSCSAMNKKILVVINQKPSQMQMMFADQLCRYQAHLFTVNEEVSALSDSPSHQDTEVVTNIPHRIHAEDLLAYFKEELARFFNQLLLVRPVDFAPSADIQPVSDMYVTLSSITYEEALKLIGSPHQLFGSQLLKAASRVDAESSHSQELGDLHSLLSCHQGSQGKSVVLFGSAGSGKSLTTLKILSEWNSKSATSLFKQFDAIVYITGRERTRLHTKDVRELWRLQHMGFSEQQEQFLLNHFSCHSEEVLFLVDGWDEGGEDGGLLEEETVLKQILHGHLFPKSSTIITSRPAPSAYPLLDICKCRYSLVGFNDRRLEELFNRRLDVSQATNLFHLLCQPSHLHIKAAVQKTPLFAAMLTELYKREETLPLTITALYKLMLEGICCRYVEWVKETQSESRSEIMMFDDKPAKGGFDAAERKLSELALTGLINNKVTFASTEVMCSGSNVFQPRFGFLSEMKQVGKHGSDVLYHFSHMTWQEYLGACNLATDPDFINKLRMCVTSIGVGEHTYIFWQFLAGLVTSQLLADLVFELLKASGVSGLAPWETEIRLLLLECVAENIRMKQTLCEQPSTDAYIQLAAEMICLSKGDIGLQGCNIGSSHLSTVGMVLQACHSISVLHYTNCHIDHPFPLAPSTVFHLDVVDFLSLTGQGACVFVQMVVNLLRRSHNLTILTCSDVPVTAECMMAFAQVINDSQSLKQLTFKKCKVGLAGLEHLCGSVFSSSSLSSLEFLFDDLSGAGALLAHLCSRLPQLKRLELAGCCLDNDDFESVLSGLQGSNIQHLHVEQNRLTDDIAIPLLQFSARRAHLTQTLQPCGVYIARNYISDEILLQLALMLPARNNIWITYGHYQIARGYVTEDDPVKKLKRCLDESVHGHVVYPYPGLRDHGCMHIARYLTTEDACLRLKTLALSMCEIGDSGVLAIAQALPKTRLQGLDLSENLLTFVGFYRLMCALSAGSSLQYLNVRQNPIFTNSTSHPSQLEPSIWTVSQLVHGLKILCMSSTSASKNIGRFENSLLALMAIPSLCALDLSNNDITDDSVAMVTRCIGNMEYLSLSGNRISSDGGKVLIAKAESLLENMETEYNLSCRLRRLWLGGNDIDGSVFVECSCHVISSESLTIQDVKPEIVQDMFSSSVAGTSPEGCLSSIRCGHNLQSPFFTRMNDVLQSRAFSDCMDRIIAENESICFDHWLIRGVHAVAYHTDTENPVGKERGLLILLCKLVSWYLQRGESLPCLAVRCCIMCVIDELIITSAQSAVSELAPQAENVLTAITEMCTEDNENLFYMMRCMSGLAERCRRRQLPCVAECLIQQMENVSQQTSTNMQSSGQ